MKNLNFKTVLTALLLVVCLSCSNNSDNADTFLIAKVDGVDFVKKEYVFAIRANDLSGINNISITASDDNARDINIKLSNIESTGTYTAIDSKIDDPLTSSYIAALSYKEGDDIWLGDFLSIEVINNAAIVTVNETKSTGTVTITEFSTGYIAGTFQFTVYSNNINGEQTKKNITEGSFRVERV